MIFFRLWGRGWCRSEGWHPPLIVLHPVGVLFCVLFLAEAYPHLSIMKDRIHLYHALDQLQTPGQDGKPVEFSFEFIPLRGNRAGEKLFASRAVINYMSKEKAELALKKAKAPNPQSVPKRQTYNHREAGVIGIRILESPDFEPGQVITPLKRYITRINDLKTFI